MKVNFLHRECPGRVLVTTGNVEDERGVKHPFNIYDYGRNIEVRACDSLGKEYGTHPFEGLILTEYA